LILLLIGAAAGTQFVMNIDGLFKTPPAILVHMNLAFYMMASSSLFVVWFVIVIIFIADRLTSGASAARRSSACSASRAFWAARPRATRSYTCA
jgi:hypothetical protein